MAESLPLDVDDTEEPVAVWAGTRRSMGEPYLRGREFAT